MVKARSANNVKNTHTHGVGGMDRAPPAQDNNGPTSTMGRENRAQGRTASGGKVQFSNSAALRLAPPIGDPGIIPAAFSRLALTSCDLYQLIAAPGVVGI